jgi:DNA-directed RNA polymerase specialized sigma24 family protein
LTPSSAVAAALDSLPASHRDALLLVRQGLTYREAAERLGQPVERVRSAVLHSVLSLTQARLAAVAVPQT